YLKGAQFALYASQNEQQPLQGPLTTDDNGVVEFTNLPYGTYWVKELSAPEGYVVNVNNRQAVLQAAQLTQAWTNAPKKGEIKVIKKDAEAADKPLSGAVFKLVSEGGVIRELTTNAQGKITFSDLAAGSYTLSEVQAPAGYIKSNEQRTFVIGKQSDASFVWEHTAEYTNARIKKTLRITKVDESGEKQQGAKFKLTGTDLAGKAITQEATTGSDGIAAFTNVPYGSYTITETLAPAGYALLAPVNAIVNASSTGEVIELSAVNKPYVLKVKKTDKGADGQALALAGAEFNILAGGSYVVADKLADGSYKYAGTTSLLSDATSFATAGAEGSFTVTHLIANTYTLKETKAPEGYVLTNETQNVTIGGTTALYERTFTNANIKGKLELLKVDGSGSRLEGIRFTITGASGTLVETTDKDGRITLNDLLFGEYSIVEDPSTAPKGMVIEDGLKVNISENGATVKYSIVNRLITGNVKLNKTDTNGKALSGASFLLTPVDENGSVISNSVYYASSNSFGVAEFNNIPYGVYALTETFPPIGFAPSDIIRYVRIGDAPVSGSIINSLEEDNENITLVNSPLLGALKLIKKDGKGNELGGAEFTLYKKQGTELLPVTLKTGEGAGRFEYDGLGSEPTHFGTNAAGEAHIGAIPYGEYEVREISAPEGYAAGEPKSFAIMNSDAEVSITMVNEEILGSIMVEKADINDPTKLLIGAQIYVYKRNEAGEPINSLGEPIANGEFLANTPLFSAATGLDGRALISSIPLGKYVAVEVSPPQGYELDGERVQPFDITAENAQISPALKLTFKNTPSQYSLKIYKVEKGKGFVSGSKNLNGARFLVTNSATGFSRVVETGKVFAMLVQEIDGSPVYTEEVTDGEDGIALLLGIPKGNYKVRELTPPEGFAADPTEHSIIVNTHGAAAEITIENTLVLGSVKL
ncbi:MAG TPA: SpaA isopeptide-forming pilin-related protein, partial [Clostridia bacterium]|nr:SpaA isopeptide-forming pilin-related protein [Clostridia bacterium]